MTVKTRLTTMAILLLISVAGGIVGQKLYGPTGFTIGILATFAALSLLLILSGKVKMY